MEVVAQQKSCLHRNHCQKQRERDTCTDQISKKI